MNTLFSDETIIKIMPRKLKEFRQKSGLTIEQVGKNLNKTRQAVSTWETGKSIPDVMTLISLCELYNIKDFNEFFDTQISPDVKSLARSEQELIFLWRQSPPAIRAAIKTLLKECNK